MNSKLLTYLRTIGLAADADDEAALEFLAGLEGDQLEVAQAITSVALEAGEGGGDPPAKDPPAADPAAAAAGDATPAKTPAEQAKELLDEQGAAYQELHEIALIAGKDLAWVEAHLGNDIKAVRKELAEEERAKRGGIQTAGGQDVRGGTDRNLSTIGPAISDAIAMKVNTPLFEMDAVTGLAIRDDEGKPKRRQPHERADKFRVMRVGDMGRVWLRSMDYPGADDLTREGALKIALDERNLQAAGGAIALSIHSTGSLTYALADSARKALMAGYELAPVNSQLWTREKMVPDFKAFNLISISDVPALEERLEGGEYRYTRISDAREQVQAVEYEAGIAITRHALLSDDLGAFGDVPRKMGATARQKDDDVVYAVPTANAALSDSVALFHAASHGNLAGTGAAITVATLSAGWAAMLLQTGPKGNHLNIEPKYLIVPVAQRFVAEMYVSPVQAAQASNVNPLTGRLTVISNSRLDAASSISWYLAADQNQFDTIVRVYVEGERAPVLKQKIDFETEDLRYAIRYTVAAKAIDYRPLYKNGGA